MKITKIPFDAFGLHFPVVMQLFMMTVIITLRNLDTNGLVYDVFQVFGVVVVILQCYSLFFIKLYRRNKKRYSTSYPALDLKTILNLSFFMIAPIGILIMLKWKMPTSSEYVLWGVSAIGIISLIYLFFKNYNIEFDEQEPFIQLIDSKKYLTFLQRNFSVEIPKEKIKTLEIDSEKKMITVDFDEKKVFKMPFHLRDQFEHMHFYFPNDHPQWFNEN